MEVATSILLIVWLVKLSAIVNATRWLKSSGAAYRDYLTKFGEPPLKEADYYRALEDNNGRCFPFGVKDFRLRKYIAREDVNRAGLLAVRFFQTVLFRFEVLIVVTAGYLFVAGWLTSRRALTILIPGDAHDCMMYWLAVLTLAANFILSIEAVYSYATLGSYAGLFHMQTSERGSGSLNELRVFVRRVFTTLVAGATAFYITYLKDGSLAGQITARESADLLHRLIIYAQCFYFTTTTFITVGYGDIYPVKGRGQLVAFLIQIQYFALIAIVFSVLQTARGGQRD